MKARARLIVVVIVLLLQSNSKAQERREKLEAMKVAFITEQLNLTVIEAQAFWPVYNEYQQKKKDLHKDREQGRKDFKENFSTLTEVEAEKMVDEDIVFRQKELDLLKTLHLKLKQILPAKKIALLYKAELDFKKQMLEKLTNKQR